MNNEKILSASKSGRPRQLHQLNWVRGIASLLVVCYHCEITMALPKYFGVDVLPFFASGYAGVQLFFVLSGFVIFLAHHNDPEHDRGTVLSFAFKRFRRLYPPLWAVLIPLTILFLAGLASTKPSIWDVIASFTILPVKNEVVLATEWTLRHEVLFYLLFAIFLWHRTIGLVLLLLWGIVGSAFAVMTQQSWLVEFLLSANHLLFLFGMGIGALYVRHKLKAGAWVLAAGILVFAITYAISLQKTGSLDLLSLGFGIGASGIIYGLCSLAFLNKPIAILDEAGAASYALYLVHYPIIALGTKALVALHHKMPLPLEIYFVLLAVICQVAAIGFHHWVEKPAIRLASRLRPGPVAAASI